MENSLIRLIFTVTELEYSKHFTKARLPNFVKYRYIVLQIESNNFDFWKRHQYRFPSLFAKVPSLSNYDPRIPIHPFSPFCIILCFSLVFSGVLIIIEANQVPADNLYILKYNSMYFVTPENTLINKCVFLYSFSIVFYSFCIFSKYNSVAD